MAQTITLTENGLHLVFAITEQNQVKLLHFSSLPFDPSTLHSMAGTDFFRPVEVMVTGEDTPGEHQGAQMTLTQPGARLLYDHHTDERNHFGRLFTLHLYDAITGLQVKCHYQFFDGIAVVRCWTELENKGDRALGLEYVTSFALTGIEKEGLSDQDDKMELWVPHNSWMREVQWQTYTFPQLGMARNSAAFRQHSSKVIRFENTGNWSAKEYLPMGYLQNRETGTNLFWQIEHNGSWHWEIGDTVGNCYLQLSGPTEKYNQWWKNLQPGESFCSVPVSVGAVQGDFDAAMGELTRYRRAIRRKNDDNEKLAVIFNDYMNCLWGDPTTEKELPLIEAAQKADCEYFVVDCGWYSKGNWWDNVGEWKESRERFPGGLKEVMDAVRAKGMIPGVWLELEVMGINCPLGPQCEDDWFFMRHGKRVCDRSRWQLDFRNPKVIEHANQVIDRLVQEYHVGYIKMDYNIEPGIGTDHNADSVGDGMLGHQRAYLKWLDGIFAKYPDLIIENCSSGGLRMDYAMLSRYSIQSTSDQEDYLRYATIASNAPTAVTPEQSAIWSYPLDGASREDAVFNMCNALLMRIHQSGHLAKIPQNQFDSVKEALDYYKTIRHDIKEALPFWPLGLSHFSDTWISLGLKTDKKTYVAVWRRHAPTGTVQLPIEHLKGHENVKVTCAYPANDPDTAFSWHAANGTLTVTLPCEISARIFEITEE